MKLFQSAPLQSPFPPAPCPHTHPSYPLLLSTILSFLARLYLTFLQPIIEKNTGKSSWGKSGKARFPPLYFSQRQNCKCKQPSTTLGCFAGVLLCRSLFISKHQLDDKFASHHITRAVISPRTRTPLSPGRCREGKVTREREGGK